VDQSSDHFLARASFTGDQDGDGGGSDAANSRKQFAHLLRDEQRTKLFFDRLLRPQRGTTPLVFPVTLQFHCGAAHAKNVLHEDRLLRQLGRLAPDHYRPSCFQAK
jgi:hypothetical protein